MIRASWADSERHRWDTLKVASQAAYEWEAPLTYEEQQWLDTHFDGEFNFLQIYGLSIYKKEDREEGRAIVRAMMRSDAKEDKVRHRAAVG